MKVSSHQPNLLDDAIAKWGSAAAVVLNVEFEGWPLGTAMRLCAMLMREIAKAEMDRRK